MSSNQSKTLESPLTRSDWLKLMIDTVWDAEDSDVFSAVLVRAIITGLLEEAEDEFNK